MGGAETGTPFGQEARMRIEKFFQHLDILIIGVAGIVVAKMAMLHLTGFIKTECHQD